jgi:hypothetical protein
MVEDILKKFGAVPYIPGQEIRHTIPTDKLLIMGNALRGQLKDKKDSA